MRCVLLAAAGAAWESRALALLERDRGLVLLRRCLDVDDLLAAATAGQADAAVLALEAPGLDASAVEHLRRHEVSAIAVLPEELSQETARARARRIGILTVLGAGEVDGLPDALHHLPPALADRSSPTEAPRPADTRVRPAVREAADLPPADAADPREPAGGGEGEPPHGRGPVIAVWGPHGAPGRTTVAVTLAGLMAAGTATPLLVDADPCGGAVAQHLGVLDEISGLLAAARLETAGDLAAHWREVPRAVPPGVEVVTGLPRADRWAEVRPGVLEHLIALGRSTGPVVVDTGASIEEDPLEVGTGRPPRNGLTLAALGAADEVLVVGSADPIGLSRLARGLVEVGEHLRAADGAGPPVRVLVNRMRPTLGWSEREIVGMVEGFARVSGVHFLPEDRASVDAALVAGCGLVEQGRSALLDALRPVARGVAGGGAGPPEKRVRRRRAGRARRP